MWKVRIYKVLTVPVFGVLYMLTLLVILLLLPFIKLKRRRAAGAIMKGWARLMFMVLGKRLHVTGHEHINRNSRYILLANHSSLFDIVAIISFFPDLSWFGHERLTRIPLFRSVLNMVNYVPMKKSTIRETKEMMSKLMENSKGHTIGIFPEGTRSLDGKMNDFYRGFVILMRNAELDLLPVTLNGFHRLKPKNRFYIGFDAKLHVTIHKPVGRAELIEMTDNVIIDKVREIIESAMEK